MFGLSIMARPRYSVPIQWASAQGVHNVGHVLRQWTIFRHRFTDATSQSAVRGVSCYPQMSGHVILCRGAAIDVIVHVPTLALPANGSRTRIPWRMYRARGAFTGFIENVPEPV